MGKFIVAIALFLVGVLVNSAGVLVGWVTGFAGIVGLNVVFVLLPGIFISYRASLKWPRHYYLWPIAMSLAPAAGAILEAVLGEGEFSVVFLVVAVVLFCLHWLSAYVAIENR